MHDEAKRLRSWRKYWAKPESKLKASRVMKEVWQRPGFRERLCRKLKGRAVWNKGKKLSKSLRKKLSDAHKGYIMPASQRAKISAAMKGKKKPKAHCDAVRRAKRRQCATPEFKEKMSRAIADKIASGEYTPPNYKWHHGDFYSRKNEKMIHYRSRLELRWYEVLEDATEVIRFCCERYRITYRFEGVTRSYVPDLYVKLADGSAMLLEFKPEGAWARNEKNRAKWRGARAWCLRRAKRTRFKVLGYRELKKGVLALMPQA